MKTTCFALLLTLHAAAATLAAAQTPGQRLTVPLSDPAQPAVVEVHTVRGGISVEGYGGRDVIVESSGGDVDERVAEKVPPGAAGMHHVPRMTGLTADEDHNHVRIEVEGWRRGTTDLRLKVPVHSSLHLSCVNSCTIQVAGVEGEMELSDVNGSIAAHDVAGSVVAHSTNGDIKVAMTRVDASKPMAFSTLNGNVDVTFPPGLQALLRLHTERGDIYTDFEISATGRPASEHTEGGRKRYDAGHEIQGTVGGGGPEILFKTFNGNILIHRAR